MKKMFLLIVIVFLFTSVCVAEKIYYKDGRVADVDIAYLKGDTVWVKSSMGSLGINVHDIAKIENDDGTISQYDFNAIFKKSQEYLAQKRYAEAMKLYTMLFRYFPDNIQIRYFYGILNQKLDKLDKAADEYTFLIEHNAADAKIFNNLGVIYAKRKKYAEARNWLEKAIANNPGMVEAHYNLAELLLETKDYGLAIHEYQKVIESEPNNTEVLYNLGIAYMNTGDYIQAKEQWERVLILKPDDASSKNGVEYLKRKIANTNKAS